MFKETSPERIRQVFAKERDVRLGEGLAHGQTSSKPLVTGTGNELTFITPGVGISYSSSELSSEQRLLRLFFCRPLELRFLFNPVALTAKCR
jgi:hypothetical protein